MSHRSASGFALITWGVLALGQVQAAEEVKLVTGEFAPYTGENLPNGGMMTELVSSIFYNLGYPVSVAYAPWKRGYQDTLAGRFTATFPYSFSKERAAEVLFSAPLRTTRVFLFVRADSPLIYTTLEDLRGTRVCAPLGHNLFPPLQEALNQRLIEVISVREMDSCFRMIENQRADATFLAADVGWRLIEQVGTRANFKTVQNPIYTVREYLIVSKTYPGAARLIEAFNWELKRFMENGRYQGLLEKHAVGE